MRRRAVMPLRKRRDVDLAAVDRLIAGDPPPQWTITEMTAAVAELTGRGYPRRLIADRMRVTIRTVTRHRGRAKETNGGPQGVAG